MHKTHVCQIQRYANDTHLPTIHMCHNNTHMPKTHPCTPTTHTSQPYTCHHNTKIPKTRQCMPKTHPCQRHKCATVTRVSNTQMQQQHTCDPPVPIIHVCLCTKDIRDSHIYLSFSLSSARSLSFLLAHESDTYFLLHSPSTLQ